MKGQNEQDIRTPPTKVAGTMRPDGPRSQPAGTLGDRIRGENPGGKLGKGK